MSDDRKSKRRWMPIFLALSLALNLLIAGVAVGTALRVRGGDHAKSPPGFGPALYRALPKDDRAALRSELSAVYRKGSRHRSEEFNALGQALRSEPFEPAAIQALLSQQALATAELQAALQEQWLVRVSAMTNAERQIYADRLEDVVRRGRHRHKNRD